MHNYTRHFTNAFRHTYTYHRYALPQKGTGEPHGRFRNLRSWFCPCHNAAPHPSPTHYAPKRRCGAMTRPHPSLSRPPLCNISSWEGNRGAPSRWQGKSGYGLGEQGIRSVGRVGTSGHVSRSLLEPLLSADTSISSDQQASDTHGPALPNTTPDASLAKLLVIREL